MSEESKPHKQEKEIIWSTEKIDLAEEKINNGLILHRGENPFYMGKIRHKKAKLAFAMTQDEQAEYIKCKMDVMYFAQNYCRVKTEDGKHRIIKLRDYQLEHLEMLIKNRFNVLMMSRQSGKSIVCGIHILHFILFNNNKNVLITANQWATIYDLIDKIKEIYINIPYFLQKGIMNWTQSSILLDNKSRIKSATVSKSSGVGANVDYWLADEYAIPEANTLVKFHTSVFPTITSMDNSKVTLISTPRGFNLFHKILTDAERPEGDPQKNNFHAKRVYWWQIPMRFCTHIRLNKSKLHTLNIDKNDLLEDLKNKYPSTKMDMSYSNELNKDIIYIYNNNECSEEDILLEEFNDIRLLEFSEITTWKKETIKDIGGEDAFNQEYGLQFVTADRSLLDEKLVEELNSNKKNFIFHDIDKFNEKLRFKWDNLKWIDNPDMFELEKAKNYKIIISVDMSEGLGQDYTVINIFKVDFKNSNIIDLYGDSFTKLTHFFKLDQVGVYRSNVIATSQVAELLYCICYDLFNEDNIKVVLELNCGGPELLAHLPNIFDGNNNYGSHLFFKYRHRVDAVKDEVGLKVTSSKNLMVKDYQDAMQSRSIVVYNEDTIRELTTFVKHETAAGNAVYKADSAHDDLAMTVVNLSTAFSKPSFVDMCDEIYSKMIDTTLKAKIDNILKLNEFKTGTDYSSVINVNRKRKFDKIFKSRTDNNGKYISPNS
jgi:hypothetical protein